MEKLPRALQLANWLDEVNAAPHPIHTKSAAAELRRLHEVNAELVAVLQDVLKRIDDSWEWWIDVPERGGFDRSMIESAIAKTTGEQP